jgi:uncharacterized membrane protein
MADRIPGSGDVSPGSHSPTIVGIFTDRAEAERAIRELNKAGFTDQHLGVAMLDRDEQRQLIEDTGSTTAAAAATGALSGGIVGGIIGLLGSLLIPGVGPIVVGGVLASTLTGAGIGAAAGGIIGALMGLGVPEDDARHFETGLRSGAVLLTVQAGNRLPEALAVLEQHDFDLGPSRGERFRSFAGRGLEDLQVEDEPVLEEEEILVVERPAAERAGRSYKGKERRRRQEAGYSGPERRELFV